MKKISILFASTFLVATSFAQTPTIKGNNHPKDHLVVQVSSDNWLNAPDSISGHIKNSSRGANIYLMFEKPFESNNKLSVAFGAGIGTSNIFFNNMNVNIIGTNSSLKFTALDTSNRFNKYKLTSCFLEAPVEFRYSSNPNNISKSFKFAIGAKIGTLLSVHTKGKTLENANNQTIQQYTEKTSSKSYFNSTKLAATARVGYGNFSIFCNYSLTPVFKDNVATDMKLIQIGLTLSGL